jgi:hypothetical protein
MDSQPKHKLKIADTPTDEEAAEIGSPEDCSLAPPALPESKSSQQSLWAEDDQPESQPGRTQRLSPKEMDKEIDRVNRLNGRPTLAKDTCRDE